MAECSVHVFKIDKYGILWSQKKRRYKLFKCRNIYLLVSNCISVQPSLKIYGTGSVLNALLKNGLLIRPLRELFKQIKQCCMERKYLLVAAVLLFTACKKDDVTVTAPRVVEALPTTITSDLTLDPNKDYTLSGLVFVKNNASLTIPAGVTVFVTKNDDPANKSSLVITQGSKLFVNGTADKPVVFTSGATTKAPGDWGAIVILGKAPTNISSGHAEGLTVSDDTKYGGTVSDDNSGSIKYLRVEYAGGINPDAEEEWEIDKVSGLCLESVGSGTTIDHVMVVHSRDDGFQFVGGTVNATHLIAYNNGDDDYDFDYGYTGKMQFVISYRSELNSTHALRANALESYNDKWPTTNVPLTRSVISNMTIIGPQGTETTPTNLNQAVYIRKGSRFVLENSVIAEYPKGGLMVCPKTRIPWVQNTGSLFRYNLVQSDTLARTFSYDNGSDPAGFYGVAGDPVLRDFAINSVNQNQLIESSADLKLGGMFKTGVPDLTPAANSPALTGANFTDADLSTFFTIVTYRGAISAANNWAASSNWAVWK